MVLCERHDYMDLKIDKKSSKFRIPKSAGNFFNDLQVTDHFGLQLTLVPKIFWPKFGPQMK